jgi:glycosyltransferase involved in cell wall biosynthesis
MLVASNEISAVHVVASVADEAAGPSYSVPRLCEALAADSINVQLFSVGEGGTHECNGYRHSRFLQDWKTVPFLTQLRVSKSLKSALLSADKADIIHAHGLWLMPNVYPAWAAKQAAKSYIVSPRGMLGSGALKFSRIRKQICWWAMQASALQAASCLHATSEQEYNDIRRAGLRQPVAVIPNGIDVPAIAPKAKSPRATRTVLFLGRLHPKKGLEGLIAAWASLEGRHPDWQLEIVGPVDNAYARSLQRVVAEKDIKRVWFIGPLYGAEKFAAYETADLFVLPTLDDNFALTVAEALAQGTPVISTKGAPWRGLDRHGCGWWIEHGVDALKMALERAMRLDRVHLAAMGAAGRNWMQREFSWGSVAREMGSVYQWLARQGPQPACIVTD